MNISDSKDSKCQLRIKSFYKKIKDREALDDEVNNFIKDNKILEEDIVEIRTLCSAESIALNDRSATMLDVGKIFLIYILIFKERHLGI